MGHIVGSATGNLRSPVWYHWKAVGEKKTVGSTREDERRPMEAAFPLESSRRKEGRNPELTLTIN